MLAFPLVRSRWRYYDRFGILGLREGLLRDMLWIFMSRRGYLRRVCCLARDHCSDQMMVAIAHIAHTTLQLSEHGEEMIVVHRHNTPRASSINVES